MITVEPLTPEQQKLNEQASEVLIPGKYYDFAPAVLATGIPTGGPTVCSREEQAKMLTFNRGWYIGYTNGNHVFQGSPINDPRKIQLPGAYSQQRLSFKHAQLIQDMRACYFHVAFIGGCKVVLSADQKA